MSRLLETFAVIWRLAHPYFFSEDRRAGRILLAGVIVIELSLVGINVHDQPLAEPLLQCAAGSRLGHLRQ